MNWTLTTFSTLTLLLVLTSNVSGEEQRVQPTTRHTGWLVTYSLLHVGDVYTTSRCLRSNLCHESNPLYRGGVGINGLLGAANVVGVDAAARKLERKHPRYANLLRWGSAVIMGVVVANNINNIRKVEGR